MSACSGTGGSDLPSGATNTGGAGNSGTAGTPGVGGQAGSQVLAGGASGSDGGIITGGSSGSAGSVDTDGGVLQDAMPDVAVDNQGCQGTPAGPGPIVRKCAPPTDNECSGSADSNPAIPNGLNGNGYDDDCDGLVDEGCICDDQHAPGTTKDCFLLPASQVDAASKQPVGWCSENSKGTVACVLKGSGEFTQRTWDGFCKGAQPPFVTDVCAPGDFDCDGKEENPKDLDCNCGGVVITCPTEPVTISPFPDPNNLENKKQNPLDPNPNAPFIVDGHSWISDGKGPSATGWKWTITGGDCDNILPHPTFAVYNQKDTTQGQRVGTETNSLGTNGKQKGIVVGPADDAHQIWPAFSLSGDYIVQGEFDLEGEHHSCTMKVQVRWPGLRAEMCWDMKPSPAFPGLPAGTRTDVDLHLARLQGNSASSHGWFDTSGTAPNSDDCYFQPDSGCITGTGAPAPGWGYTASASESCHGWGSLRDNTQTCDNPRLDRDNITCDVDVNDPNVKPDALFGGGFCGPENINIDNPKANDQFAVGVQFYDGDVDAHPHVNIYCNGERKLALGNDPTTTPPVTFPVLKVPGQVDGGDMWEVARITWKGTATDPCDIETIPSKNPKTNKDGSTALCVDTNPQNSSTASAWLFTPGGGYPTAPGTPPGNMCWH
jgi:hypothetical protein